VADATAAEKYLSGFERVKVNSGETLAALAHEHPLWVACEPAC